MHSEIIKYFQSFSKHWCVISQCDPNDMNICMDGTMFDYTAGGYVPLMAEYATYFWYNFGQAEMLSIKYNKNAFRGYENIQDILKNDVIVKNNKILYLPRKIRMDAIIYYTKNIMKPILDNIDNKTWYTEFKNYLAMKILAVFDFSILKREDILFSISFLQLLYNKNIVFIDELINLLEGWKCWYD